MTMLATLQTAQRIIRMAYRDAALIQEGDEPTSEQYADGILRLNDMVNFWQTQGLKLWLQSDLPVPLTTGKGTYSLAIGGDVNLAKPLRVLQAYYLDINNIRRPLLVLSREEYSRLSTPLQNGAINSYFVDKQQNQLLVSMWLVPDATAAAGTVHLIIETQAPQVVSLTSNIGFPVEWGLALRWGLADDIATGQPDSITKRCTERAQFYRTALEDWDVEDASTMFTPDQRTQYANASFR